MKNIFLINLNHRLTLFLEDIGEYKNFDHSHLEYIHYETVSKNFLSYLESIKNTKFDKKTTNFLYNLYELQRGLCNHVFIVRETEIEACLTETGYPEFIEEYYIDRKRLIELIKELQDINLKIHNHLFG